MRQLLSIFFVFGFTMAFSQSGYKLDFKINGWKDTTVYLFNYYGESTLVLDTAKVNTQGGFTFDGKNDLKQGVYFLVLGKSRIPFDFMIGADQHFGMETSSDDFFANMKVTGDEDNQLFFESIMFKVAKQKEADPFIKILQDTTLKDEKAKKAARDGYEKITSEYLGHQQDVINKHPATMTARVFNATLPVKTPDTPKKPDGSVDSLAQFHNYRDHYFDNFDLSDDALIRLPKPFYQDKVKEYLNKLFIPQPDTITKAINQLVAKAKKNQETYKYLVYTCVFLYQTPEIMGLDEVFVNLYNTYFATGEMDYWANAQLKKNLKEHSEKLSRGMIGRTGPNMMMQDQNLQPKSMYDIKKKYTLLWFFDPDCGHCRQETPKLVEFYNKNKTKYDLEVFAVDIDTTLQKMKDFIKEMKTSWITVNGPRTYLKEPFRNLYYSETTPTLYVLDDKKKIIARKLGVEKLDEFLSNYEKFLKRKPAPGTKGT